MKRSGRRSARSVCRACRAGEKDDREGVASGAQKGRAAKGRLGTEGELGQRRGGEGGRRREGKGHIQLGGFGLVWRETLCWRCCFARSFRRSMSFISTA